MKLGITKRSKAVTPEVAEELDSVAKDNGFEARDPVPEERPVARGKRKPGRKKGPSTVQVHPRIREAYADEFYNEVDRLSQRREFSQGELFELMWDAYKRQKEVVT